MSNLKRTMVLAISMFVLLSLMFAGCSGKQSEDSTETTAPTSVDAAAEATQDPVVTAEPLPEVKLTWYLLSNAQPDDDMVYGMANEYIKDKINATVDFYPLNMGEYNDKIKVKLAGGDPLDIVFTSSWLNSYNDNIAKGALLPLDDLLDNYGSDLKASIPEIYWNMVKVMNTGDDMARIYGVPNYQIEVSVNGLAFRKDLAEKYNLVEAISNIKNYDDITPLLKTIKDNEPDIYPLIDANLAPELKYELTMDPIPYEYVTLGIYVDTRDFTVKNLADPELAAIEMQVSQIRRDWYLNGYIDKNAITVNVDLEPYKNQGKVFLYQLGACKPGVEVEEKTKYGYDIIAVQTRAPVTSVGQVTATMNAIPINSENPERAMMLLNLVNTDKELYNLLNFGIEDTHYTKIDDNTIQVLQDSTFNPGMAWALGNQFNAYLQEGQPAWEETIKLNERAISSPLEGFSFNSEPVKTELAQMTNVDLKYNKILLNGAADPEETIAKRNKEWNINDNWQKVVDEVQKQLNEWLAANGK